MNTSRHLFFTGPPPTRSKTNSFDDAKRPLSQDSMLFGSQMSSNTSNEANSNSQRMKQDDLRAAAKFEDITLRNRHNDISKKLDCLESMLHQLLEYRLKQDLIPTKASNLEMMLISHIKFSETILETIQQNQKKLLLLNESAATSRNETVAVVSSHEHSNPVQIINDSESDSDSDSESEGAAISVAQYLILKRKRSDEASTRSSAKISKTMESGKGILNLPGIIPIVQQKLLEERKSLQPISMDECDTRLQHDSNPLQKPTYTDTIMPGVNVSNIPLSGGLNSHHPLHPKSVSHSAKNTTASSIASNKTVQCLSKNSQRLPLQHPQYSRPTSLPLSVPKGIMIRNISPGKALDSLLGLANININNNTSCGTTAVPSQGILNPRHDRQQQQKFNDSTVDAQHALFTKSAVNNRVVKKNSGLVSVSKLDSRDKESSLKPGSILSRPARDGARIRDEKPVSSFQNQNSVCKLALRDNHINEAEKGSVNCGATDGLPFPQKLSTVCPPAVNTQPQSKYTMKIVVNEEALNNVKYPNAVGIPESVPKSRFPFDTRNWLSFNDPRTRKQYIPISVVPMDDGEKRTCGTQSKPSRFAVLMTIRNTDRDSKDDEEYQTCYFKNTPLNSIYWFSAILMVSVSGMVSLEFTAKSHVQPLKVTIPIIETTPLYNVPKDEYVTIEDVKLAASSSSDKCPISSQADNEAVNSTDSNTAAGPTFASNDKTVFDVRESKPLESKGGNVMVNPSARDNSIVTEQCILNPKSCENDDATIGPSDEDDDADSIMTEPIMMG